MHAKIQKHITSLKFEHNFAAICLIVPHLIVTVKLYSFLKEEQRELNIQNDSGYEQSWLLFEHKQMDIEFNIIAQLSIKQKKKNQLGDRYTV